MIYTLLAIPRVILQDGRPLGSIPNSAVNAKEFLKRIAPEGNRMSLK